MIIFLVITCFFLLEPPAMPTDQPCDAIWVLEGVRFQDDRLGWRGLFIGMSVTQAEKTLATELDPNIQEENLCGGMTAKTELSGCEIWLTFSGPSDDDLLNSIAITLPPGPSIGTLRAVLRSQIPNLEYWLGRHSRGDPYLSEGNNLMPNYRLDGEAKYVVLLKPDYAVVLSTAACVD